MNREDNRMLRYWSLFCLLMFPAVAVMAQGSVPFDHEKIIATASPLTDLQTVDLQLASAADASSSSSDVHADNGDQPYKSRWLTANKLHKYLGLGSITAAGLTVLTAGDDEGGNGDGGIHHQLAYTALGLGAAAVLTGLIFHWDDITLANGFSDPDNLHMLLTTLGTLGYARAVDLAPGDGHSGYGSSGALSMLLGIKMVW